MAIHRWNYCIGRGPALFRLSLLTLCAIAGCWQEVEYTAPPADNEPPPATTEQVDANVDDPSKAATDDTQADDNEPDITQSENGSLSESAEAFADDLAQSLTADPVSDAAAIADTETPENQPGAAVPPDDDALFGEPTTEMVSTAGQPRNHEASDTSAEPIAGETYAPSTSQGPTDEIDPLFAEPIVEEPVSHLENTLPVETDPNPTTSRYGAQATSESTDAPAASQQVLRAAWLLGSKLSLAALSHGQGAAGEETQKFMEQAHTLARSLDVAVPDLPPRPLTTSLDAVPEKALEYLFAAGRQIGGELAKKHGPEAAALFELAVKTNLLLVLYQPGGAAVDAMSTAISQAGARAKLPADLSQPLLDLLTQQAAPADVRSAVYQTHSAIDAHLSGAISSGGTP